MADSLVIEADLSNSNEAEQMIAKAHKHFGKIDVLVNNAAVGLHSLVESLSHEQLNYVFNLNLIGPLKAMQTVVPIMKAQGGGSIVNVSSKVTLTHIPALSGYAASKSALNMITLTARAELEQFGIKVSLVYPGLTATDFVSNSLNSRHDYTASHFPNADSPQKVAERIVRIIKTGDAEDIL